MSWNKAAEAIIREAMERGEFDNLAGHGKPIDLNAYFETPEELRMMFSVLKNAGVVPEEIDLLNEMAALKERLDGTFEENERRRIRKLISNKQMRFNLIMGRRRRG
jgi:hypothetical protein